MRGSAGGSGGGGGGWGSKGGVAKVRGPGGPAGGSHGARTVVPGGGACTVSAMRVTADGATLGSGTGAAVSYAPPVSGPTASDAESKRSSRLSAAWLAPVSGAESSYSLRHQSSSWAAGLSPC